MSNIMAIRSLFGIKAGGKITLNMIMPYIKLEKKVEIYIGFCYVGQNEDFQTLMEC